LIYYAAQMIIANRYRVVYRKENGRRKVVHVWAKNSVAAKERVAGFEDVDSVERARRANGPVLAALIGVGIAALMILSAILRR